MIDREIASLLREAIHGARASGELAFEGEPPAFDVTRPRSPEHGDWSTNAALVCQREAGIPPRRIAETIVAHLPARGWVLEVQIAGPGFINFRVSDDWLHGAVGRALALGDRYGATDEGAGRPVNIEFVSINPTGPLLVSHGRNAALGDSIARLLQFTGWKVTREYYLNDAGNQLRLFLESIAARYKQACGVDTDLPEDGYRGDYVHDLASELKEKVGDGQAGSSLQDLTPVVREHVYPTVLRWIREVLQRMRIEFDVWFSEAAELHETGLVEKTVGTLEAQGHVYTDEGAVWLRTSEIGDRRDRALVTSDGRYTYLAADLAYHVHKHSRGFERMVDVIGADHHGQVPSLLAGCQMLGIDATQVEVVIYQWVHLVRGGEAVGMSKRLGAGVALDELLDEVGPDAARYTFLHTSADTTLNFDIEAVTRQSLENPVYYVQYSHARICSIFRKAADAVSSDGSVDLAQLTHPSEVELMKAIYEFEEVVQGAASARAPHRLTRYAEDLAKSFNGFYRDCPVLRADPEIARARLALCRATRHVLANTLDLLGVNAPERMDRED